MTKQKKVKKPAPRITIGTKIYSQSGVEYQVIDIGNVYVIAVPTDMRSHYGGRTIHYPKGDIGYYRGKWILTSNPSKDFPTLKD